MSRPGKRSEGVKKETLRQVPEEANRVEKRYFSGRPANVNIWGFFSRSEAGQAKKSPAGDFWGSILFIQKGTTLLWEIATMTF